MRAMHEGQWDVTAEDARGLVTAQFPQWQELTVAPLASDGTVNTLFRLGSRYVLRFPLLPSDAAPSSTWRSSVEAMLDSLADHVPIVVPKRMATGRPTSLYPGYWSVHEWVDGEPATTARAGCRFVDDLAGVVAVLHGLPTHGRSWDGTSRGGPLADWDEQVRECLGASRQLLDVGPLEREWANCVLAPCHRGPDVWIHGDLMPGNLLMRGGRLDAVIDWEEAGIGDPAVDLMPAWNLLGPSSRSNFRRRLAIDDGTWRRGRGWALCQAIVALPYYADTNCQIVDTALRTLTAVVDDASSTDRD